MERQAVTKVQKMPFGNNHPRQQFAPSSSARNPLLELQRSVGNQAIQRLTSSPFIQAKLKISTPGDPFEQEADRIADTVMRMPEPTVSRQAVVQPALSHITPLAQRETDRPDEENEIVSPKSKSRIPVAVRDDDDEEEKPLVQRACAEFGTGQYAPESRDGRQLLAHELTHVVQQNGNHMQSAQPLSIQRWEWFDQMRRVGPYDMILAGLAANEAKFEAEHSLLPGFSDGPQDAFRHTYWSCLLALDIGADQAKEVGDIHEDQAPHVSPMITLMDQHNNAIDRVPHRAGEGDGRAPQEANSGRRREGERSPEQRAHRGDEEGGQPVLVGLLPRPLRVEPGRRRIGDASPAKAEPPLRTTDQGHVDIRGRG